MIHDINAAGNTGQEFLVQYLDLPRYKWILALSVGCFLMLFMLFLQPFGVTNHDPRFHITLEFLLMMCGIGAVVVAALAVSEFLMCGLNWPEITRIQFSLRALARRILA